ncbi:MAG: rhomboid family intramembrane serine protease [Phycisphaerae bacterium]|nr:rhomboid family intramembrane serine protease [Phycisphaerae bacterium]
MFIPYEVDAPFDHRPVVNWLILVGIVSVFVIQVIISEKVATEKPKRTADTSIEEVIRPTVEENTTGEQADEKQIVPEPIARFVLNGWGIGLFTYIWLHGGILKGIVRVIGNLIFLWPFGNAVCAKIGNKLYLPVYLGFGLLAGAFHLLLADKTAMGAAGAISGIVGMYIVLFPENSINCFFFVPRPVALGISGCWIVLFWFIFDILEMGLGGQSVTYCAHLLCTGAGAGLAVLMLKRKWLVMERDEKSLLQMLSKVKKEDQTKEDEKKEKKDSDTDEKPPEAVDKEKTELEGTAAGVEKPEDDFIRFKCECGHRIKIHKRDAGKTGRCPKCLRWVEAPRK